MAALRPRRSCLAVPGSSVKMLDKAQGLPADQVFKAIGQTLEDETAAGLTLTAGRIETDAEGRTSRAGVWAGGDCIAAGDDLTVTAVAQGRDAAESINRYLAGN